MPLLSDANMHTVALVCFLWYNFSIKQSGGYIYGYML